MSAIQTISTQQLAQRILQGGAFQFWNVLTDEYFKGEMIVGSLRVPVDGVGRGRECLGLPKTRKSSCTARTGVRRSAEMPRTSSDARVHQRARVQGQACRVEASRPPGDSVGDCGRGVTVMDSTNLGWSATPVTERLGIRYPIVQGPFGGAIHRGVGAAATTPADSGPFGAGQMEPDDIPGRERHSTADIRSRFAPSISGYRSPPIWSHRRRRTSTPRRSSYTPVHSMPKCMQSRHPFTTWWGTRRTGEVCPASGCRSRGAPCGLQFHLWCSIGRRAEGMQTSRQCDVGDGNQRRGSRGARRRRRGCDRGVGH